jgi:hypothetical protein
MVIFSIDVVGSESSGDTRRALDLVNAAKNLMTIIADFYHMEFKYNLSYCGDFTNEYGW